MSPSRRRPRRVDGLPPLPENRMKFWILTCLEQIGEGGSLPIATWYEERVLQRQLDGPAFGRLLHNVDEIARRAASYERRAYLLRRTALVQYAGETRARARSVYKVSAYGRKWLLKVRSGDLPGCPPDLLVPGLARTLDRS